MTVFKGALRRGLMKPASLLANCVLPIVFMVAAQSETFAMEGGRGLFMLAFLLMFGAFMMAGGIQADKLSGVTTRILAGPITFRSYLIQNFLAGIVPMSVLMLVLGGMGIVLHEWTLPFALGVALLLLMLSTTSIGLSFVWACLFKDKEASVVAFTLIMMLMGMVGGLMFPQSVMPPALRHIGAIFPPHWVARGLEDMIVYGAFTTEYWLSLLALVLFSVALLAYGSKKRLA